MLLLDALIFDPFVFVLPLPHLLLTHPHFSRPKICFALDCTPVFAPCLLPNGALYAYVCQI
jgi:hypothetical protein